METLLLLVVIVVVAAVFVWLGRSLGDAWPPVAAPPDAAELSPQPTPTVVSPAATVVAPLPEEEFALSAASAPSLGASVAAPAVSPANLRAPAAVPARPRPPVVLPEGAALRRVTWALAAGGGLLLALTLWAGRSVPPGQQLPGLALTLIGGLALLLGAQTFARGRLAGWFGRPLARLALLLRITPAQAVLLLLALPFAWLTRQASGNGLLAYNETVAVLAWLTAAGLVVAGSVAPRAERPTGAGWRALGLDRWDVVLSLVLFALALGLRAYAAARYPTTYSGDEGSAGLYAVELLTGKANNLFGLGWFSFPSLYFTVQSAAIALLGQTVEAVRLTSAVAGALTVVALYWLGRAMFNRTTALLAALYLTASHFHIHMSRIALNNVWDGLFGTLAILGLWYGWQTGRRAGFILCGLALGLGQYFYVSIRPLPILFLIWAAVAFWRQRPLFRERFHGLVLATVIALVVFLPLALYFVDKPDEFQAPMNRVTIFGSWLEGELAHGDRTTAEIIIDNAVKGAMGFTHEPLRLLYNPGSPLLLAGAALLFLLGILWALLNFDLRYLLLLLPLLAVVASNAVSQDSPASQRYVLAMPLVALFVALPLGEAVVWLRGQYPRYRPAVVVAAFALLAIVAAVDINYYFNRVYPGGYVLGGLNTEVATEIGYYLRDKQPANEDVFFFGFPRMGYFSLSTIPFLAPDKQAQDVIEPLTGPAALPLRGPTLFIFLPERLNELPFVQQQAPGGTTQEFRDENGELLFVVYESP